MEMEAKAQQIAVRLRPEARTQFINLAAKYGGTSYVLRELVEAFIDNRVEIAAPKNPLFTLKKGKS